VVGFPSTARETASHRCENPAQASQML
jgi:hypothetical protein